MAVIWGYKQRYFHPVILFLSRNSQQCDSLVCRFRIKRKRKTAPRHSRAFCGLGTVLPSGIMFGNKFCDLFHRFRISKLFLCDKFHYQAVDVERSWSKRQKLRVEANEKLRKKWLSTWWLLKDFSSFMYFKQYSHRYNVFTLPYSSGYGEKYHVSISKCPIRSVSMYFTFVIASCSFSNAAERVNCFFFRLVVHRFRVALHDELLLQIFSRFDFEKNSSLYITFSYNGWTFF